MDQKGFISIILTLFILAVAAVAGYSYLGENLSQISLPAPKALVTPAPTNTKETANWKTYTNSKYGYSIKYPSQWNTNSPPSGPGILIGQGPNEDQINIDTSLTKNAIMVESCKQTQQVFLDNIPASRCEFTQEISGERGVVYNPPIVSKTVYIEALHNGQYYSIVLTSDETSDKFKIFNQILSTFKFTDQNEAITQEQAASIVQNLPEVKNFIQNVKNSKIALEGESKDKSAWMIHVYEDLPDHIATFGWYNVDKFTGKATDVTVTGI